MNTFVHTKSGNRYPQSGCACWFRTDSPKPEVFIKPGYAECTKGWKRMKLKEWREETIPDLAKPFTRQQFIDYAKQYGVTCAQEFLDCCDYSKPSSAYQLINPPNNEPEWTAAAAWFQGMFGCPIWQFTDGLMLGMANTYSFDVIRFEKYLATKFDYPMHKDGSMKDFMIAKFGKPTVDKFAGLFFH